MGGGESREFFGCSVPAFSGDVCEVNLSMWVEGSPESFLDAAFLPSQMMFVRSICLCGSGVLRVFWMQRSCLLR